MPRAAKPSGVPASRMSETARDLTRATAGKKFRLENALKTESDGCDRHLIQRISEVK